MSSPVKKLIEAFLLGLLFVTKGPFQYFHLKTLTGRALTIFMAIVSNGQDRPKLDPKLTEVWEPVPDKVMPGENSAPPSDAIEVSQEDDEKKKKAVTENTANVAAEDQSSTDLASENGSSDSRKLTNDEQLDLAFGNGKKPYKPINLYEQIDLVNEEFDEEVLHMRQLLKTRLVDLDLSVRALNCLKAADVDTLGELVVYNRNDLLKFRNFGKKSLTELDELLENLNLSFGMDIAKYKLDKD